MDCTELNTTEQLSLSPVGDFWSYSLDWVISLFGLQVHVSIYPLPSPSCRANSSSVVCRLCVSSASVSLEGNPSGSNKAGKGPQSLTSNSKTLMRGPSCSPIMACLVLCSSLLRELISLSDWTYSEWSLGFLNPYQIAVFIAAIGFCWLHHLLALCLEHNNTKKYFQWMTVCSRLVFMDSGHCIWILD